MNSNEIINLVTLVAKKSKVGRTDRDIVRLIELDSIRFRQELGDRVLDLEECKLAKKKLDWQYRQIDSRIDTINNSIELSLILPIITNLFLQYYSCTIEILIGVNLLLVVVFMTVYWLYCRPCFRKSKESLVALQLAEEAEILALRQA